MNAQRLAELLRRTAHPAAAPPPLGLAARARQRPLEPIPWIPSRWALPLAAAALLTAAVSLPFASLPLADGDFSSRFAQTDGRLLPTAPGLPSLPTLESPAIYLAAFAKAFTPESP